MTARRLDSKSIRDSDPPTKQPLNRERWLSLPPLADEAAAQLRAFGFPGVLAMTIIMAAQILAPLSAVLILVWAKLSRTPWLRLGLARPGSWTATLAGGLIFGICFKLLMKSLVMPLLGAPEANHSYQFLAGNRIALAVLVPVVIIKAGFGEEIFFRGYLFERLGRLLGETRIKQFAIVLLTSVLFALLHYDQGLPGIEQALITGVVFGTIFAISRKLWMLIIAHAAFDLAALAIIYWRLESQLAHLIFKT